MQLKYAFSVPLKLQVFFAASQSDLQSETDLLHKLEATVAQLQQAGPPAPIPVKVLCYPISSHAKVFLQLTYLVKSRCSLVFVLFPDDRYGPPSSNTTQE